MIRLYRDWELSQLSRAAAAAQMIIFSVGDQGCLVSLQTLLPTMKEISHQVREGVGVHCVDLVLLVVQVEGCLLLPTAWAPGLAVQRHGEGEADVADVGGRVERWRRPLVTLWQTRLLTFWVLPAAGSPTAAWGSAGPPATRCAWRWSCWLCSTGSTRRSAGCRAWPALGGSPAPRRRSAGRRCDQRPVPASPHTPRLPTLQR